MSNPVVHDAALGRFELRLPEGAAVCCYRRDGPVLVLHHTEVPWSLRGRGVAGQVVQAALDWAAAQGLRVRPSCSYVAAYMRRHPDSLNLLDTPGARP